MEIFLISAALAGVMLIRGEQLRGNAYFNASTERCGRNVIK